MSSLPISADARPVAAETPAPARRLPAPRLGAIGVSLGGIGVLAYALAATQSAQQVVLLVLGVALGVALYHARFGFTSAFRRLVAVGNPEGLRAHLLMLAVATVVFAPLLATGAGLFGTSAEGEVAPIGLSVVVGAFLFGVGMQLGGACASGSLYTVGGGQTAILITLAGFIAGSVLGSWNWGFWTQDAFTAGPVALNDALGYAGGAAIQLAFLGLLALGTVWLQRRRNPPPAARPPAAQGLARALRGSWPLWVGAIALAVLNGLVLVVKGSPWGITSPFALWGAHIAQHLGIDVSGWEYWQSASHAKSLHQSVLADGSSLTNFGIILGAMLAAGIGGTFAVHRRVPWRTAVAALAGGLLMGYGARLAFGCNIGAYFSGTASQSLHGWLWAAMALAGTYAGLRLRPLFGLGVPKPGDSSC